MIAAYKKALLISAVVVTTSLGLIGYWVAWMDWVSDARTGAYANNHLEATGETFALLLYSLLAIRFLRNRISLP